MFSDSTKRIVVIKDIPSNLIEEAIFILKNEPGPNKINKPVVDVLHKNRKRENDYLLKEAEMIINSYIKDYKVDGKSNTLTSLKLNTPKNRLLTNTLINIALVGSVAALIFIITRLI